MPRGLLLAIAVVYLWAFPYFRGIHHANELPRIYLTQAIVDEGTFAVDRGVQRHGATADLARRDGRFYSNKAPGMSLLAVPVYAVAKLAYRVAGQGEVPLFTLTWLCRAVVTGLPAILLLGLFFRVAEHLSGSRPAAWFATCALALGSGGTPYAVQFMAHHVAGLCLVTALALGVLAQTPRALGGAGLCLGLAALIEYQAVLLGFPVGVYLLARHRRWLPGTRHDLHPHGEARRGHPYLWLAAGVLPPVVLLLGYHWACFGSPLKTGYDFAATEAFAAGHQRGLLGLEPPELERLVGSLVGGRTGMLTVSPVLLLAPAGILLLALDRARRGVAAALAGCLGVALAFAAGYFFWNTGWQVGQRYVAAAAPLLVLPVAPAVAPLLVEGHPARRALLGLALGLLVASVAMATPSTLLFPHWPDPFENPLRELVLPLVRDGYAPYSLGRVLGLPGAWSLAPALAVALGAALWPVMRGQPPRWLPLVLGVAALGAALHLGRTYRLPGGDPARVARAYEFVTRIWEPARVKLPPP